jgi:hypothetical protein
MIYFRGHWQDAENMVENFRVSCKVANFLPSWTTLTFSRMIPLADRLHTSDFEL